MPLRKKMWSDAKIAVTYTRRGTLTSASHGSVFSGFVSGGVTNGYRGTARENTRTREARLAATTRAARVASFDCRRTERNMRAKMRRMWRPRPIDWNEPPGIASNVSAPMPAARYAGRLVHRDAVAESIRAVAATVAIAHSRGGARMGSVRLASNDSRAT